MQIILEAVLHSKAISYNIKEMMYPHWFYGSFFVTKINST